MEEGPFDGKTEQPHAGGKLLPFSAVGVGAFTTHLPCVRALAAGVAFHGIKTDSLDDLDELDWVAVPGSLARRNRFVVRVAVESMEPTLRRGELVVFEYHRSPRCDGEIVIANLPEFGADGGTGTETIKRIRQDVEHWIFTPDNPAHEPIRVPKGEVSHPILGTFVAKV